MPKFETQKYKALLEKPELLPAQKLLWTLLTALENVPQKSLRYEGTIGWLAVETMQAHITLELKKHNASMDDLFNLEGKSFKDPEVKEASKDLLKTAYGVLSSALSDDTIRQGRSRNPGYNITDPLEKIVL